MNEDRKNYCRFCGVNKGHETASCKNLREIKKVLAMTDESLKGETSHRRSLAEKLAKIENWESHSQLQHRQILALLELVEIKRTR